MRRFIPAYAGNSESEVQEQFADAVHPRLRGELTPTGEKNTAVRGSSPLTRGTRTIRSWETKFYRFIPAYAGNSTIKVSTIAPLTVHPRLRGELT